MNAHGACFAYLNTNGRIATLFCFTRKDYTEKITLFIVEVGTQNNPLKVQAEIKLKQQNDYIVAMVPSKKYGCLYAISQQGTLFIYDIQSGELIFQRQISDVCKYHTSYNHIIFTNI